MRLNASIPALLALAALLLLPATLLAKTTHRRARKTAVTTSAHKRTKTAEKVRATSGRRARRAAVERVSTREVRGRHLHRPGKSPARRVRTEEASTRTPEKATSSDFIKAATAQPETAAHAEEHADAPQPVRRSRRSRHAKAVPVSTPDRETPRTHETETAYAAPAPTPVVLYNKRGRLIIPPPLRGSHEILVHQNEVADQDGLTRIQNDEDLMEMRDKGLLVAVPTSAALEVDSRLPDNRRYCRPWVARFLVNLARAHYARFHTPLQVNSAVRTVDFQEHLIHINGNAAPAEGDTASPHLTGQAVDLAKHGLSRTEIAWMRGYLLPLAQEGKIDVEEEFKQSCFHISVYKTYVPSDSTPRRSIAATSGSEAALATALH
ncbi:DUF5715 family protein [Edaphobacter acidisoli]|uniref:DUF5715 family protein n=1 Tax=Edaphobacter acidisoli TaxID=2040573 RepID=UPI0016655E88|nr:DUF5715 family protein [Edaphobacter acidisoli]